MIGAPESNARCPSCGGRLRQDVATIPYIFPNTVIVIKHVPAYVCANCQESYTIGAVTDRIAQWLDRLKNLRTEVSVVAYEEWDKVPV
jgi:YgiT-type zinc finger domain-containing protein